MYKIDNVYSSVWIATALLSYEKYLTLSDNNDFIIKLSDFYFSQAIIRKIAKKICNNQIDPARTSQWCNGSHKNGTYNYLVSKKNDSKRRLSLQGEFGFVKEFPSEEYNHLNLAFTVNQREISISYNDLLDWVKKTYYSFPLSSDDSDVYIYDKVPLPSQLIKKTPTNFFPEIEKFNLSEELTETDEIYDLILKFLDEIQENRVEIYNEFSLQHELGIFLRQNLSSNTKVQFERNVYYFFNSKIGFTKKEMDIVIFSEDFSFKVCIELKFPQNGKIPENMFDICKDIAFIEELSNKGFSNCYQLTIVSSNLYYSGKTNRANIIYDYFRHSKFLHGKVIKPTGEKDETLHIDGTYSLTWKNLNDYKFLLVKI